MSKSKPMEIKEKMLKLRGIKKNLKQKKPKTVEMGELLSILGIDQGQDYLHSEMDFFYDLFKTDAFLKNYSILINDGNGEGLNFTVIRDN